MGRVKVRGFIGSNAPSELEVLLEVGGRPCHDLVRVGGGVRVRLRVRARVSGEW